MTTTMPAHPGHSRSVLVFLILVAVIAASGAIAAERAAAPADKTVAKIGGDDVSIGSVDYGYGTSTAIASNGDIYTAIGGVSPLTLTVYRSTDGGTTWEPWGSFDGTATDSYRYGQLLVAEGAQDRLFLTCVNSSTTSGTVIEVMSCNLGGSTPVWTTVTAMDVTGVIFGNPRLATDAAEYSEYYLYLVAEGLDADGSDIWFARSTNQGTSFETPSRIANMSIGGRNYRRPDVTYQTGGKVHVAWEYMSDSGEFDFGLRYRQATNFGGNWGGIIALTSTTDGVDQKWPRIAASPVLSQVVVLYYANDGAASTRVRISVNGGASFPDDVRASTTFLNAWDVACDPVTGDWVIGGESSYDGPVIAKAASATPQTWGQPQSLSPEGRGLKASFALDPSHGNRVGAVWFETADNVVDDMTFDAEWRSDPGYPVTEPNFPVALTSAPRSAPAVVDMDGDGDLEIVFGDALGRIQAFHHNGSPVSGWPVTVGHTLSVGPVAIAAFGLGPDVSIVAGTQDGFVVCYDADGQVANGDWPYDSGLGLPAFVAIGDLGFGYYRNGIAVAVGARQIFLDHLGRLYPGSVPKTGLGTANQAPAIGDVNGDGMPEVVTVHGDVLSYGAANSTDSNGMIFENTVSGAPTLADFDGDGDDEMVIPMANGELHVLDDGLADLPGFPYASAAGTALSTAALGNIAGTAQPEIIVADRSFAVHLLYYDGTEGYGYPADTAGWLNYSSPIIAQVSENLVPEVVLGTRGEQAWAWSNLGSLIDGWPKPTGDNFYVAPAAGDLDGDGANEIVLVGQSSLWVFDVSSSPEIYGGLDIWPMAGFNAARTGCLNPLNNRTTAVDPGDEQAVTRVSFATPSPNPTSGSALFRFAVPRRATAELAVYDVRGRRIRLVSNGEVEPGEHVVAWDGLGADGRALASGVYFARLSVHGPSIDRELTRKVILAK